MDEAFTFSPICFYVHCDSLKLLWQLIYQLCHVVCHDFESWFNIESGHVSGDNESSLSISRHQLTFCWLLLSSLQLFTDRFFSTNARIELLTILVTCKYLIQITIRCAVLVHLKAICMENPTLLIHSFVSTFYLHPTRVNIRPVDDRKLWTKQIVRTVYYMTQ